MWHGLVILWALLCAGACSGTQAFDCQQDTDCQGGFACAGGSCLETCGEARPCLHGGTCDVAQGICLADVPAASSSGAGSSSSDNAPSTSASSAAASTTSSPSSSSTATSAPQASSASSVPSSAAGTSAPAVASSSSLGGHSSSGPRPDPDCVDAQGNLQPAGRVCSNLDFCTVGETCDASGQCVGGQPRSCSDYHPMCVSARSACTCQDNSTCQGGFCVGGTCVVTLAVGVAGNHDDGFEYASDVVDRDSAFVLLSAASDTALLRFDNLPVPRGSRALHAALVLFVDNNASDVANENWTVQADVNPSGIGSASTNISTRPVVATAGVVWNIATGRGWQLSPELAPLVNTLFSDAGWGPDNAVAFLGRRATSNGVFTFRTQEHLPVGDFAPYLDLVFTLP